MIVLRREVNSYHPKPRQIDGFKELKPEVIDSLKDMRIKTTVQLFDLVCSKDRRIELCNKINIDGGAAVELAKLTDFSRMRYVNQDFASLLLNSDYDTIEKIKLADYELLHKHLHELNGDKKYFKAKIALSDMKLFIQDAHFVSSAIDWE